MHKTKKCYTHVWTTAFVTAFAHGMHAIIILNTHLYIKTLNKHGRKSLSSNPDRGLDSRLIIIIGGV